MESIFILMMDTLLIDLYFLKKHPFRFAECWKADFLFLTLLFSASVGNQIRNIPFAQSVMCVLLGVVIINCFKGRTFYLILRYIKFAMPFLCGSIICYSWPLETGIVYRDDVSYLASITVTAITHFGIGAFQIKKAINISKT